MPKTHKKIRAAALARTQERHAPLGQVMVDDARGEIVVSHRRRMPGKRRSNDDDQDNAELSAKESSRILQLSKEQQLEEQTAQAAAATSIERRGQQPEDRKRYLRDSDEEDESEHGETSDNNDDEYVEIDDQGYVQVNAENDMLRDDDQAPSTTTPAAERQTLADLIFAKIHEKQQEQNSTTGPLLPPEQTLPPKVVQVYTDIGRILARYTSGKLPKAFKVIPSLTNWEEILYLTRPESWTPPAMYQATRLFASNLNPKMAQRFYHLVLLDAVRQDIFANKKLNYHYYASLKKAVYKPAAFFKGILLPLCQDGTLREAVILASVVQRVSIPVHHAAVCLFKLANSHDTDYSGPTCVLVKALLNKKYALPAPVVDALVQYFCRFTSMTLSLPVLWHQTLLVLVQRYKHSMEYHREALRQLCKVHYHHQITPEVRRELFGAQAFREERQQNHDTDAAPMQLYAR